MQQSVKQSRKATGASPSVIKALWHSHQRRRRRRSHRSNI